jgi:hypothetical protein
MDTIKCKITNPIVLRLSNKTGSQINNIVLFDPIDHKSLVSEPDIEVQGFIDPGNSKEIYNYQDILDFLKINSVKVKEIRLLNFSGPSWAVYLPIRYYKSSLLHKSSTSPFTIDEIKIYPSIPVMETVTKFLFNETLDEESRFLIDMPAYSIIQILFILEKQS